MHSCTLLLRWVNAGGFGGRQEASLWWLAPLLVAPLPHHLHHHHHHHHRHQHHHHAKEQKKTSSGQLCIVNHSQKSQKSPEKVKVGKRKMEI